MKVRVQESSQSAGGNAFRGFLLLLLLHAAASVSSRAASPSPATNEECLACHGDKSMSVEHSGRTVSLYVDGKKLAVSAHASLGCTACHASLEGQEIPHGAPVERVDCGLCHAPEQEQHARSLHGKAVARGDPLAPRCKDCHGKHDIFPVKDPRSAVAPLRVPFVCGRCHREGTPVQRNRDIPQSNILENYSESIHGEGLLKKGLIVAPTCATCHTAHLILPHTDPASSIARKNIAATCTRCHAQIEEVHRKTIKGELWEKQSHILPACVDCHQPHKIRNVFYEQGMADADCLRCHGNPRLRRARDSRSMFVPAAELAGSRHSKIACSQCHSEVNASRLRPCETITRPVDCTACHEEIGRQYQSSTHGQLLGAKNPVAPDCRECHGTHAVLGKSNPASPSFPTNIPALCARCHREGQKAAARYTGTQHEIIEHYTESIHGKGLLKSGLTVTATCTNCHTAHRVLPRSDPQSSVNHANVPATCGQCHHGIQEQFDRSVHVRGNGKNGHPLPVCNDCHTAHTIRRADEDAFKLDIMTKCGRCHEEIAKTYFDTYHGKVSRLGYTKTAKCYDCHGAHDVRAVADPNSRLSRANVVATCQKCHPGATRRFAGYLTHATHHDPRKYPFLFAAFWGMTALLAGTFLVSGLHTLLWIPRAFQMRRELRTAAVPPAGERQFVRFTRLHRVLHTGMILCFMSLALTGLTLKFSYTGWAVTLSRLLGGFETAGYIHRAAAVVMFSVFVMHLLDLLRLKRHEYHSWKALLFGPDSMLPGRRDFSEFIATVKWFVGRGPRPSYGRWTYWEKFDYFAVFWGIAIIGATGLTLWFPVFFTRVLPGMFLNVATIIHSDEALLATGFIFTVHFFNTHLRPEKFPMDITIFTGRVALEEMRRDKPREVQALAAAGKLEEKMDAAYPPIVTRTIRAFAWSALAVGFSIVLWILYAMLFAYR
ncbi:MAG: cytochrome c3 family protein [Acidobacteriia bacterium]|nr:cytochrome c3 family protein [Terriglobia bacterium]